MEEKEKNREVIIIGDPGRVPECFEEAKRIASKSGLIIIGPTVVDFGKRFEEAGRSAAEALRDLSESLRSLKKNQSFEKPGSKYHK